MPRCCYAQHIRDCRQLGIPAARQRGGEVRSQLEQAGSKGSPAPAGGEGAVEQRAAVQIPAGQGAAGQARSGLAGRRMGRRACGRRAREGQPGARPASRAWPSRLTHRLRHLREPQRLQYNRVPQHVQYSVYRTHKTLS